MGAPDEGGGERAERSERPAPASRQAAAKPATKSSTAFDDMDNDIPF
jgi:single-strand DNA-binding protein